MDCPHPGTLSRLGSLGKLGLCDDAIFTKVSIDQPEGKTYSIQLVFHDEVQKEHFLSQYLPEIEAGIARRYANRYVCFNSILRNLIPWKNLSWA